MKLCNVILEVEIIVSGETGDEVKENATNILNAILRNGTGNWFNVSNPRIVNMTEVTE